MNKILCPIDFSEVALNALEYAAVVAEHLESELLILHVYTPEEFNKVITQQKLGTFDDLKAGAEEKLATITEEIRKDFPGINGVRHMIQPGVFIEVMEEVIEGELIKMVIMGTQGVSNVVEAWVGSNAVRTIEDTNVPVMVVPGKASFEGLSNIVFATNYEHHDKVVIQEIIGMAVPFDASVTILHMDPVDKPVDDLRYENYVNDINQFIGYKKVDFMKGEYQEQLGRELDRYMMENNSDLLCILKTRQNFIERLFHHSVTKEMAYLIDYPMLVFKE